MDGVGLDLSDQHLVVLKTDNNCLLSNKCEKKKNIECYNTGGKNTQRLRAMDCQKWMVLGGQNIIKKKKRDAGKTYKKVKI